MGFPGGASGKEPTCQHRKHKRPRFDPWVGKIPWRRAWQPTPVFLPRESHGQRSLVGYSPQGRKESDLTHTHCLHSGDSQLTFQHPWRKVLISPHPLQPSFLVECLTMAILTSARWYLTVVLIWISLIFSKIDIISCDFFKDMSETSCSQLLSLPCVVLNTPRPPLKVDVLYSQPHRPSEY